jgi:hypothetical protein
LGKKWKEKTNDKKVKEEAGEEQKREGRREYIVSMFLKSMKHFR